MKQRRQVEPNCKRVPLPDKPESATFSESPGAVMTMQLAAPLNFGLDEW